MMLVPPNDPTLWNKAMPVQDFDREVRPYLTDMWKIMTTHDPDAVALAAPQVGLPLRFFITDGRWAPSVAINPEILRYSTETESVEEGCLTWPGKKIAVVRPYWIRVRFTNIAGRVREDTIRGVPARIFQHEIDHLEGRCIFPRST